jgi:Na+-driven multidrug efflux pump
MQNSIISFANIFVQSNINKFGKAAMAGCGSYSKIEGFGFLPISCFTLALTTFVGQNLGAKQYERAKRGALFGVICSVSIAEIIGLIIWIFAPQLISLFQDKPEVIAFGTEQARTVTLFYCLLAFSHCCAAILRGSGKSAVPMYTMLACWCVIRITYIYIATNYFPVIRTVFWAYPITWTLSSVVLCIYLLKADWLHNFDRMKQKEPALDTDAVSI